MRRTAPALVGPAIALLATIACAQARHPCLGTVVDEADKALWKTSPRIQDRIKELGVKDEHELQSWFIGQHLQARGEKS